MSTGRESVEWRFRLLTDLSAAVSASNDETDLQVFEGPYEYATVVRMLLSKRGLILGVDVFEYRDAPCARIWESSPDGSVAEIGELVGSFLSSHSLLETLIARSAMDHEQAPNPATEGALHYEGAKDILTMLLVRASESGWEGRVSAAARLLAGSRGDILSFVQKLRSVRLLDAEAFVEHLDKALRHLLGGTKRDNLPGVAAAHAEFRQLAANPVVKLLSDEHFASGSEDLQRLVAWTYPSDLGEPILSLQLIARWWRRHDRSAAILLANTLVEGGWAMSDDETADLLSLAAGVMNLNESNPLLSETDPGVRALAVALLFDSRSGNPSDAVTASNIISEIATRVDVSPHIQMLVKREMRQRPSRRTLDSLGVDPSDDLLNGLTWRRRQNMWASDDEYEAILSAASSKLIAEYIRPVLKDGVLAVQVAGLVAGAVARRVIGRRLGSGVA